MKIKESALALNFVSVKTKDVFLTLSLIAASIIAPAIFAHTPQNQWLTGTLVNGILFFAAWRLGWMNALLVAIFPSTIALLRGLLPAPLALMIPYIIFSNILLISVSAFSPKKSALAILLASSVKFFFLYASTWLLIQKLNPSVVSMMHWPQLITALAGGFLAVGVTKLAHRNSHPAAN